MRSGILVGLIVVVLCACGIATERPAQFSRGDIIIALSGDPNEPNVPAGPQAWDDPNRTWDPAEHLVADWESVSVSMTSRLYNPTVQPNPPAPGPQWSFSIAAIVDLIDDEGLIGWTMTPTSVQAFAPDGSLIASSGPRSALMVRSYQQPRSLGALPGIPSDVFANRFSLNLPVDANAAYPEVLSRVEWTMNVLLADQVATADVPFEPNETWVELTPGMEIMVEQATVEQDKYQYRIQIRYDRTKVDYLMSGSVSLWRDEQPPAAAVLNMDLLTADGELIPVQSWGFSASGSNNQMTGSASGSGSCATCGDAAILRYTLGFGLYEQEVRFVLENIPVPEF